MKKIFGILLAAGLLLALSSGCGEKTSSSGDATGDSMIQMDSSADAAVSADAQESETTSGDAVVAGIDLTTCESISIAVSVADIEIVTGDTAQISYHSSESRFDPTFSVSESSLSITQGNLSDFTTKDAFEGLHIVITLPESQVVTTVSLVDSYGNVTVSGVQIENLAISLDCGEVAVSDVTSVTMDVNNSLGNVTLSDNAFTALSVNASLGDIVVNGVNDVTRYTLALKADLGVLTIDGDSITGLSNEYTQEGIGEGTITLNADMGNITLES